MTHGFDLDNPLVCEGIVGDGCGGGRLFMVEDEILFAYDPQTQEKILLLKDIFEAESVKKSGCIIEIKCSSNIVIFDLSSLKKV